MRRNRWTREQLLVAFKLYCQLPFGKLHSQHPEIIKYSKLIGRTPSALAMKLTNIASLDPVITFSGRKGLRGASIADKKMWEEMQSNWEDFAKESEKIANELLLGNFEKQAITQTPEESESDNYEGKSRIIQVEGRVGQAFFRKSVFSAYNGRCCISGLSVPNLLIASHIIPWKDDKSNRLNPKNGLLLSSLHDKAFDIGIITVSEEMKVLVSEREREIKDHFFKSSIRSFEGKKITLPQKFSPDPAFLKFHRENIFEQY
ncbi:MAG: HNH endonuclease [Candidatus Electrothrix sp. AW3_4]|nr:HNH endonuclease [Candidatus Electrothrix gigas]